MVGAFVLYNIVWSRDGDIPFKYDHKISESLLFCVWISTALGTDLLCMDRSSGGDLFYIFVFYRVGKEAFCS